MNKRLSPYDLLGDPQHLLAAWKKVRACQGAAGIDQITLAEYARDLMTSLDALAQRLREGRYYPLPVRTVEMRKASGGTRTLGILTIEDRIVQRAALDAVEPLFESVFLDCSFGFRPNRSTAMAVQRVLDYRAAGDVYVVDADIRDCFGSLDHELIISLFNSYIRDKRMQNLVRMWLDTGMALPKSDQTASASLSDRVSDYVTGSLDGAVTHLLAERGYGGYGYSYPTTGVYGAEAMDEATAAQELHRQARKEAFKQLGKNGLLLALTFSSRARKLMSPTTLVLTGAAALATAAYPSVSRAVKRHFGTDEARRKGAVQGGSMSPLLANLCLHEFDLAMTQAGLHLVRYADDFLIMTRDEASARRALELADRKLAELRLRIHPDKTRITRFDAGLEFLGFRFEQFQNTAIPISPKDTSPVVTALQAMKDHTPAAIAAARNKVAPVVTRIGERTARQVKDGVTRIKTLLRRKEKGGTE